MIACIQIPCTPAHRAQAACEILLSVRWGFKWLKHLFDDREHAHDFFDMPVRRGLVIHGVMLNYERPAVRITVSKVDVYLTEPD